ncbi:MAG: gliding motility-associated C-terminal domain-containing protein, partial [Bacteroidales bacterium]
SSLAVTVNPGTPAVPGVITGTAAVCPGLTGQIYSISSVTNATTYNWSVPAGWVITAGSGTISITVTCGTSGQNGNITVTAGNSCGTSPAAALAVTVSSQSIPPTGVNITNNNTCSGSAKTLTATGGSLGTDATWEWYTGSCGGTSAGTGLTIIVDPAQGTSTTYYVLASGTCNTTVCSSGTVVVTPTVGTPDVPSPSAVTICHGSGNTVFTTSAPNATGYNWTVSGTGNSITGTGSSGTVTWAAGFSGTATVSVTANGCSGPSSSASTIVTVRPTPTATVTGTTSICQNESAPIITFTNPQALSVTITYNINGTNQNTISVDPNSSATISAPANIAGTFAYNLVSVIYQSSPGCSNTITGTATITVNPLPVPSLISSDADNIFCVGTSVTFTAGGGTSYNFRVSGTSVQDSPSLSYTTSSLINGQTVDVIVTTVNGCMATSSGITNYVNPLPFIFITVPAACSPDLTTYSLSVVVNSGTVTSTSGVVTNTGGSVWAISGVPSGTNITVKVTDSGGCVNSIVVTAPNCSCPIVSAPVSGGDKSYCASGAVPEITATVLSGETVDWYNTSSGGTLLKGSSPNFTPSAAGTYYALARNTTTGCVSSTRTPVTVTMNPLPAATLVSSDPDNIICAGTTITFTAGGGTTYNFRVGGVTVQNGTSPTYITNSLTNGQVVDVVVTNSNNCAATSAGITTIVNALPSPSLSSSDADNSFCSGTSVTFTAGGGTNYNFRVNGVSVQNSASPTYITSSLTNGQVVDVVVTNSNNCVATSAGITNTVKAIPTPTLTSSDTDNIFCSGTSVTFTASGGTNYNFRVSGSSVQNGSSPTFTSSSLTNGQVVVVEVSNSVGCTITSAGITNTVNPQPVANAGTGGNACDLNFKFSAVPSIGTGTWSLISGPGTATFDPSSNSPSAKVSVSEYGLYTFAWTEVSGACSSSSSVTVTFYQQPVASVGTGGNICGLGLYLNGSLNVGIGTWTKVSGPGDAVFSPDENTADALVTVSAFGNYTFKWSVINGTCTAFASESATFIEQPPANAGTGGVECDKDFVLNAVITTGTGTWTKIDGPGNAVFSPDNHHPNATVTVDQFGTYDFEWTVVNSSCTSSDKVKVGFHDLPSVNAGKDTVICKGTNIQFHATGTGTFAWIPAKLVSDSTLADPISAPVLSTKYTVFLIDQFGCKNSDSIFVEVREKSVAFAGNNQSLDYLFETIMDAQLAHNYETGMWSVISGTGDFLDKTDGKTTVNRLSLGGNKFSWTVSNGYCPSSSDTVIVFVNDLVIPTLITPNMDGRNDYFVLKGLSTLGKTELIIFDRRGAEVYKNMDYDNRWNGIDYNGKPLPDDTYFYILRAANGKSKSGYIVIRR